jgi:hypothetical protein
MVFLTKDIQEVENYLLLKAMVGMGKLNMRQWHCCSCLYLNMLKVAEVKEEGAMKQVLLRLILLTVLILLQLKRCIMNLHEKQGLMMLLRLLNMKSIKSCCTNCKTNHSALYVACILYAYFIRCLVFMLFNKLPKQDGHQYYLEYAG